MRNGTKILLAVNKLFKTPVHPFNLQNEGEKNYAEWQYEKGPESIKFYKPFSEPEREFMNKIILDIGCGAGGKSLYYASLGAKKVYGADVVKEYETESLKLAERLNLEDKFSFCLEDASHLDFENDFFDIIIMNDSMEHVSEPEKVLEESFRVLKDTGRIYINFCPYCHPYGAHLSDMIGIPWVHMFFSEETMIEAYECLVGNMPDAEFRKNFRFSKTESGKKEISYINKMTIKRFKKILAGCGLEVVYYKETPLKRILLPLAKCPVIKEMFVKMVTVILKKPIRKNNIKIKKMLANGKVL